VLDPLPPGSETSYGNAGLASPDTAIPIAMPGMLRQLPRMLVDATGPLKLHAGSLPRILPWIVRWLAAAREKNVLRISAAMRALHRNALADWRDLVGSARFDRLVREAGQLRVWEGKGGPSRGEMLLHERHGIPIEEVAGQRLRELAPGLTPSFRRGVVFPGNGYTVDPRALVASLAERLQELGGVLRQERVVALCPGLGGGNWRLMTTSGDRPARVVVIAAGLWSRELLRPLGIRLPLESERGYHASVPGMRLELPQPVIFPQAGFVVTPMQTGVRIAGTVEIGAHPNAPDYRRAEMLLAHAARAFPDLQSQRAQAQLWSGDRPSTPDGLPLLGAVRGWPGLHLCTGHGHFGLTASPRSGEIVALSILEDSAACTLAASYDSDRSIVRSAADPTPSVIQTP